MRKYKETMVGVFIIISIASMIFFLIKFGKVEFSKNYYGLRVEFNDVSNLEPGTPVMLGGVKIGKVDDIYLERDKVIVQLSIRKSIKIKKGAKVSILLKGLIGDVIVSIYNPVSGNNYMPDDLLKGEEPLSLTILVEKTYRIMEMMEKFNEQIEKLSLEDTQTIVDNFKETSVKLNKTIDNTNRVLNSAFELIESNKESLENTMKKTDNLIDKTTNLIVKNDSKIEKLTDETLNLINELKELVKSNTGDINKIVDNFNKFSESMLELSKTVSKKDITDLKDDIFKITEDSKTIVDEVKIIIGESDTIKISSSINNINDVTKKLTHLFKNSLSFESELESNKEGDLFANFNLELRNTDLDYFIKVGKDNLNNDFGTNRIILGKYFKNYIVGAGMIQDKVGIQFKGLINKNFSIGMEYFDIDENKLIFNTDLNIDNAKIYLKYDIEDVFYFGVGYKF